MPLLEGKTVANQIYEQLKERVQDLHKKGVYPSLVAINVGYHKPSLVYLKIKEEQAKNLGINFKLIQLDSNVDKAEILLAIKKANSIPSSGVIFQLPLPERLQSDQAEILNSILPEKDIDLLTDVNRNLLAQGKTRFVPPTAGAILKLLQAYNVDLFSQTILIIGRGALVGKPLSQLLNNLNVKFSLAGKTTEGLPNLIKEATLIISATGQPHLIKAADLTQGVIIVDAGTAESGGKILGDVDRDAAEKASLITPVTGGVGPVTVAQLMTNVVEASERGLT